MFLTKFSRGMFSPLEERKEKKANTNGGTIPWQKK
jgi:hypothetical protein